MRKILALLSWLILGSFSAFVRCSVKKGVSFVDVKVEAEPLIQRVSLREAILSLDSGIDLLGELLHYYQVDDDTYLTDSMISKFLVSEMKLAELNQLNEFLVVDEEVLDAFCDVAVDNHAFRVNFVLKSFPALASEEALLMMAGDLDKFMVGLRVISDLEPVSFVNALPALKQAINNDCRFMELLWLCLRLFSLEATVAESVRVRKKCFKALAVEFLTATKTCPFNVERELLRLPSVSQEILIPLTIELGCLEFLQLLIKVNIVVPFHRFEDGVVSGNALMFVQRNAQILSELISVGAPLEELIISKHKKRTRVISVFTFLFLQGDAEMNTILKSLEYKTDTYILLSRESVTYNLPELAEFAKSRFADAAAVIEQAEADKQENARQSASRDELDDFGDNFVPKLRNFPVEELEDSGFSHHGFA